MAGRTAGRGIVTNWLKSLFGKESEAAVDPVADTGVSVKAKESGIPESVAKPIHTTDETFEETVLHAPQPALVDFWADWCGPCRMMAPSIDELAKEYDGRAVIAKIDTDRHMQVAGRLGISGLPTVVLFKNGQEVERVVGFAPKRVLEEKLDAILA
jgi:thioredoxin 1